MNDSEKWLLSCQICNDLCKRAVSVKCCGARACRACATKKVTSSRFCWNVCCRVPLTTDALQNDDDLRTGVEHVKANKPIPSHILLKLKGIKQEEGIKSEPTSPIKVEPKESSNDNIGSDGNNVKHIDEINIKKEPNSDHKEIKNPQAVTSKDNLEFSSKVEKRWHCGKIYEVHTDRYLESENCDDEEIQTWTEKELEGKSLLPSRKEKYYKSRVVPIRKEGFRSKVGQLSCDNFEQNVNKFILGLNQKKGQTPVSWVRKMVAENRLTIKIKDGKYKSLWAFQIKIEEFNISTTAVHQRIGKAMHSVFRYVAMKLAFHLHMLPFDGDEDQLETRLRKMPRFNILDPELEKKVDFVGKETIIRGREVHNRRWDHVFNFDRHQKRVRERKRQVCSEIAKIRKNDDRQTESQSNEPQQNYQQEQHDYQQSNNSKDYQQPNFYQPQNYQDPNNYLGIYLAYNPSKYSKIFSNYQHQQQNYQQEQHDYQQSNNSKDYQQPNFYQPQNYQDPNNYQQHTYNPSKYFKTK